MSRCERVARVLGARGLRRLVGGQWRSSDAPEGDGDVGAAEAEGVVEGRDVARRQVARRRRDVELDLRGPGRRG